VTTVILDTDVSSLIIKRQLPARLAAALAGHLPAITFITVAELRPGSSRGPRAGSGSPS
jgi:hypothetical protein